MLTESDIIREEAELGSGEGSEVGEASIQNAMGYASSDMGKGLIRELAFRR